MFANLHIKEQTCKFSYFFLKNNQIIFLLISCGQELPNHNFCSLITFFNNVDAFLYVICIYFHSV